jgi:hypothetical protein
MSVSKNWPKPSDSIPGSECGVSLRRDNPAQRVPPRQHDATMIHLYCERQLFRQAFTLNQRASTGWAPVRLHGLGQHRMTLAADSFHLY